MIKPNVEKLLLLDWKYTDEDAFMLHLDTFYILLYEYRKNVCFGISLDSPSVQDIDVKIDTIDQDGLRKLWNALHDLRESRLQAICKEIRKEYFYG